MELKLYIQGKEVELQDVASTVALTYSFSDLYEPDKLKDTYSKTISIPGTPTNDSIFKFAWRMDANNPTRYNPIERVTYELMLSNELLSAGYIKLNSVVRTGTTWTYNVTLYGDVTNYMTALGNRLLKDCYVSKQAGNLTHILNKEFVSNSWDEGINYSGVTYVPCNNGQYDAFENGKELKVDASSNLVVGDIMKAPVINGTVKYTMAETSEMDEIAKLEFRSSRQRPALAVQPMLQACADPQDDDFEAYLSDNWNNEDNPYMYDSVMTLPMIDWKDAKVQPLAPEIGSFAKVSNNTRYNVSTFSLSNCTKIETGANYALYRYKPGIRPVVTQFDSFDGTNVVNLSNIPMTGLHVQTLDIDLECMIGLQVEVESAYKSIINGLYTGSSNPSSVSSDTYGQVRAINFWDPTNSTVTGAACNLEITPYAYIPYAESPTGYITVELWPVWNGKGTSSTDDLYGLFSTTDMFRCVGSTCEPESMISSSGGGTGANRLDWTWHSNGRLAMNFGYYKTPFGISACPWQNMPSTSLYSESSAWSDSRRKYGCRPQHWHSLVYNPYTDGTVPDIEIVFEIKVPNWLTLTTRGQGADYVQTLKNFGMTNVVANTDYKIKYTPYFMLASVEDEKLQEPEGTTISSNTSVIHPVLNYASVLKNYGMSLSDVKIATNLTENGEDLAYSYLITADQLLDNETTTRDILLNYTKLFGYFYDIKRDDGIVKVNICDRNEYFSGYKILDWSDKVDYSQDFTIVPLTFDTKYLTMKYKDGKTYYEEKHRNKYSKDFGEARINTGYLFSDTSKELSQKYFTNTVIAPTREFYTSSSGFMLSDVTQAYTYRFSNIDFPNLPTYFKNNDGNGKRQPADVKYNMLFVNDLVKPDYNENFILSITDDCPQMFSSAGLGGSDKPCWYNTKLTGVVNNIVQPFRDTYANYMIPRNSIRLYSTLNADKTHSWDFERPMESYSGETDSTYSEAATIYSRFWRRYLSEIYDSRNKIVTCFVHLTPSDMVNFSFKNFVIIDGVLYHPNKIIDYKPLLNIPTKVELISVQDITAYTQGVDMY